MSNGKPDWERLNEDLQSLRQRLAESEQRLRLALDATSLGLWNWDVESGRVILDERSAAMLGNTQPKSELQYHSWDGLIHPDDGRPARERLDDYVAGRRSQYEAEYRLRHSSGEWIWVQARGEVVSRDRAGRPLRLCGTHLKITRPKQAEAALAELTEKHRRLEANIPGMVYVYALRPDGSHAFPYVNAASRELFGLEPEDVMRDGTRLSELIHPEDRARRDESIRHSAETLQPWRQELRHIVDGRVRWHDCMSRPERQPDGTILWDGIILEITDRKRGEDERARLAAILESTSDFVGTTTPDGRLTFLNAAGRRLVGSDADEDVTRRVIPDLHPAWATARIQNEGIPAALARHVWHGETALLHRDGHEIPVSQVIIAHRDRRGTVQYLSTIMRDITERKRSEEALRESETKYRALFEAAGDAIFLLQLDAAEVRVIECNDRALELFGTTRDQLLRSAILDLSPAVQRDGRPSREVAANRMTRALAGETQSFEWRHRRWDGTAFDADVVLTRVPHGEGQHLLAMVRDVTQRKQTEEALFKREHLLNNIIDQSPHAIWISDAQGTLIRINEACCELLHVRAQELIHKYNVLQDNIVREQGYLPLVQAVFTEGRTVHFTLEYDSARLEHLRLERTTCVTVEVTIAPVKDEQGAVTNAVVMHHDISQRVRAEHELRESERKYRALSQEFQAILEAIPGSLVLISPDFRVVWANEFAATSLGLTPASFLGQHCYYSRHQRSEPCEVCPVRSCLASGKPETGEGRTSDGRIWELRASPLFDDQGTVQGVIEVGYDVTESRRADRELQANASMLRSVFRATPIGLTFNVGWVLASVNESMCELTGYSPQELLGKSARMLYVTQEEYDDIGRKLYAPLPRKTGHTSVETRFCRKDGAIINVMLTGAMLRPEDPAAGFVVTVQDITARTRAEQEKQSLEAQLRQAQKMEAIGQLAGGVAHDFNNILTAIFGHVELAIADLQAHLPTARSTLDGMQQIQRSAERASALTRQLLALSRRQVTRPAVLNLNVTLHDLQKMLHRLITENIELAIALAPKLPAIEADPGQLEQVIVNLVVNARDAMPAGGKLVVETGVVVLDESYIAAHADARPGEHVLLTVRDTGCGIHEATLEHIFEPFFTTKPRGYGTGLGLSTVYGIVKQAGGHITVFSEPAHGTTFRIYLPSVHKPVTPARHVRSEPAPPVGTETVLLCEDDSAVRQLAAHVLAEAGYAVLVAQDAGHALQLADDHAGPIQLLLTDVIMPDLDGRQLVDALRKRRPNTKVLFISGYTSDVIAHCGVLEKGVELLEKPFSRRSLLQRVRELLDKPALTQ